MLPRRAIGKFTRPRIDEPDVFAEVGSLDVSDGLNWCIGNDPKFFTQFAYQGVSGYLVSIHVSAREVPSVWIPASVRVSVAEQNLI
ncbi:MAG: hypothetical protein WA991_00525 [Ornithinimicrobium sp.]